MFPMYVPDAIGGQDRVLDPLELESWIVMNHRVGAENLACIFCKSNKCS